MSEIVGTQSTIDVEESEGGMVRLHQKMNTGEEQTMFLELHQVESLSNWFTQFVRTARDDLSEE